MQDRWPHSLCSVGARGLGGSLPAPAAMVWETGGVSDEMGAQAPSHPEGGSWEPPGEARGLGKGSEKGWKEDRTESSPVLTSWTPGLLSWGPWLLPGWSTPLSLAPLASGVVGVLWMGGMGRGILSSL